MPKLLKFATLGLCMSAAGSVFAGGVPYADREAVVYPYATAHNYCPEGLQPVTVTGVISCGRPTADVPSYQHVKMHGSRRHVARRHKSSECPIGEKGCH